MSKTLAITPLFAAWRRAADRLLTLETAVALRKRTLFVGPPPQQAAEDLEIAQVRLLANQLFQVANDEAQLARRPSQATVKAA